MLKYSCPHCGAVYYGPGTRPEETDRCGYCRKPIRAIYLTVEEYEAEQPGSSLAECQGCRTYAARRNARAYRGGLAGWGVV